MEQNNSKEIVCSSDASEPMNVSENVETELENITVKKHEVKVETNEGLCRTSYDLETKKEVELTLEKLNLNASSGTETPEKAQTINRERYRGNYKKKHVETRSSSKLRFEDKPCSISESDFELLPMDHPDREDYVLVESKLQVTDGGWWYRRSVPRVPGAAKVVDKFQRRVYVRKDYAQRTAANRKDENQGSEASSSASKPSTNQ